MTPPTAVDAFSAFALELHDRSRSHEPAPLFKWSLDTLTDIVNADCAWGGWVDLQSDEIEICASTVNRLPEDFPQFWKQIQHEDLLARDIVGTGSDVAYYDRYGARHTEGMIALSDRYDIDKMAVVTSHQPACAVSLFMSCYRSGARAAPIGAEETSILRNALNHVRHLVSQDASKAGFETLLANAQGRILSASAGARYFIRDRWRGWKGEYLPADLMASQSPYRCRRLTDMGLAMDRRLLADGFGQILFHIALRPASHGDRLSSRERQIAEEIVEGGTYKEIAKRLDLSPATVRNHTQAILRKLSLHSRGALARRIQTISLA